MHLIDLGGLMHNPLHPLRVRTPHGLWVRQDQLPLDLLSKYPNYDHYIIRKNGWWEAQTWTLATGGLWITEKAAVTMRKSTKRERDFYNSPIKVKVVL